MTHRLLQRPSFVVLAAAMQLTALAGLPACAPGAHVPTAEEKAAAQAELDAYVDQRFDAPAGATQALVKSLGDRGFTITDVEAMLRAGRASYPAPAQAPGDAPHKVDVSCYHVVYSSVYYIYVPASYDPAIAWPLVVVGHGGNSSMSEAEATSTAFSYIRTYLRSLKTDTFQPILIAPATTVGWSPIGDSLIESAISQVIRGYHVDPDKIYVTGQSMGGHLTWRSALTFGDRFAAYSPQSGGYTSYIDNNLIQNLYPTHGYGTVGSMDIYDLTNTNIALDGWLTAHHYDWKIVVKDGGHDIYEDEQPTVAAFFDAHPRDLYRNTTYLRSGGAMKYVSNWADQDYQILPDHPLRWNFRHYIEVTPRPDSMDTLTFSAVHDGNNHIEIHADKIRHLKVLLHPRFIDFTKPVSITVNGAELYNAVPTPALDQLLDRVRETDDRGRIFHAAVDLDVTTDETIPDPVGP